MFPDGSYVDLMTGLSLAYDVVADDSGVMFVADFMAQSLVRRETDGSTYVIASIAPDNTDLALDADGNLYLNNAAAGFARVDKVTGALTPMSLTSSPCPVVQSPADVVFDDSGRAVFASWVDSKLSWADFDADTGGVLLHQRWANSHAVDVGPDGSLYVGVDGCGSTTPSRVVSFTANGTSEVYLDGLTGLIGDIAFDPAGGLYVSLSTETNVGIYYHDPLLDTVSLVPGSTTYDTSSLATDPFSGNLFASLPPASPTAANATIQEFTPLGLQATHVVDLPEPVMGLSLDTAPDGTLYGFASERARFMSGPQVYRWILRFDLTSGAYQTVAQITREGCCPMGGFSVDPDGYIWWVLNPDFLLYRVSPAGVAELFASNLPVDAGSVSKNADGDMFLNTPEGIVRIWQPTLGERVELIIEDLDEFAAFGVLSEGRSNALRSKLQSAVASFDRGQSDAAVNQLEAFLRSLIAYVRGGHLSELLADQLLLAVDDVIDRV